MVRAGEAQILPYVIVRRTPVSRPEEAGESAAEIAGGGIHRVSPGVAQLTLEVVAETFAELYLQPLIVR